MGLWVRKFPCDCCGKNVIFDADNRVISCGCGKYQARHLSCKTLLDHFFPFHPMTIGEHKRYVKRE